MPFARRGFLLAVTFFATSFAKDMPKIEKYLPRNSRQSCTCTVSNQLPHCSCRPLALQGYAVQLTCTCDPPQAPQCRCTNPFYIMPEQKQMCIVSCTNSCQDTCERNERLRKRCPKLCAASCSESCKGASRDVLSMKHVTTPSQNTPTLLTAKMQTTAINKNPILSMLNTILTTTETTLTSSAPVSQNVSYSERKKEPKDMELKSQKTSDVNPVQQLISVAPQLGKALLMTVEEQLKRLISQAFGKWNETRANMTPQQRRDAEKVFHVINSVGQLQSLVIEPSPGRYYSTYSNYTTRSSNPEITTPIPPAALASVAQKKLTTVQANLPITNQIHASYGSYAKQPDAVHVDVLLNQNAVVLHQMREEVSRTNPTYYRVPSTLSKPFSVVKLLQGTKCELACEDACKPQCVTQGIPLSRCVIYCTSACKETCKMREH